MLRNQNEDEAGSISHFKLDQKCENGRNFNGIIMRGRGIFISQPCKLR